eukprot:EG_transcript_6634
MGNAPVAALDRDGDVEGPVPPVPAPVAPHVEEYRQSLRRYELTAIHLHHALSAKKDKPPPPPTTEPKRPGLEAWTVAQLAEFVQSGLLSHYGSTFGAAPEVVDNFRTHLIDGSAVGQLQPEDWRQLCPYIGPRLWLARRLKEVADGTSATHPPAATPPATGPAPAASVPAAPSGSPQSAPEAKAEPVAGPPSEATLSAPGDASQDVLRFLNSDPHAKPATRPALPKHRGYQATAATVRMGRSREVHPVTSATSPSPPRAGSPPPAAAAAASPGEGLPDDDLDLDLDAGTPTLRQLLFGRSRFSNHRLIDTPWRPSSHTPAVVRFWQTVVYKMLRFLFLCFTALRVGTEPTAVAFLALPAACTAVCRWQGWLYDFSPTIFVTVVVFPLTFSVNAAYQRREQALQVLAQIKAAALIVYLTARTWPGTQPKLPEHYGATTSHMVKGLFRNYGHYLTAANETHRATILDNTYQLYLDLVLHIDLFRLCDLPPPLVAMPLNNLTLMMQCFEKLRVYCDYRTPSTLRSFFWACVVVLSFLMGPYCASLGNKYGYVYGYLVNLTFFWLLLCLNNIQRILENPFSTHGEDSADEDDINLLTLRGGSDGPAVPPHPPPAVPK